MDRVALDGPAWVWKWPSPHDRNCSSVWIRTFEKRVEVQPNRFAKLLVQCVCNGSLTVTVMFSFTICFPHVKEHMRELQTAVRTCHHHHITRPRN